MRNGSEYFGVSISDVKHCVPIVRYGYWSRCRVDDLKFDGDAWISNNNNAT